MQLDYKKIQAIDTIKSVEDKMVAAAKMYAENGFYVIPIRPNEKGIPQKRSGLNYSNASNKVATVEKWFTGKYKGWNIGLCCGADDGIFVLDVDNKDENGFIALEAMEEDHGEFHTMTQITPSGGKHFVFQWFDSGRSSTSKIAKGIDTRGGDGKNRSHIVAWPSTINGKPYTWERVGAVVNAPEWLEDMMGIPWDGSTSGRGTGRGNEGMDTDDMETVYTPRQLWNMLKCINPDGLSYEEWLHVGQALHSQHPDPTGLKLWDKWSSSGERYEHDECVKRWEGFKPYGPIRIGTLIHYAKEGGYVVKPTVAEVDFSGEQKEYEDIIEAMNAEWGIAVVGGKIRVVGQSINNDPEQDLQLMNLDDFKALNMNRKIAVNTASGVKQVPISLIWLSDEDRKEYRGGIHFRPDMPREFDSPNGLTYNMWRGWTVEPQEGDWSRLKEHICDVICSGNEEHYTWLLDWMADIYQDPANPKGCAIVMHGIEGTGKGTVMEAIGRTVGRHYKHLTQEKHLTGAFNGHLQDALLIFADEVTYGGSRKTSGTIKAMVTEPKLMVERKGVDAYSFKNCARVGIASNEDWFIPAGPNSRRWFVLETSAKRVLDREYYNAIYDEMENGGLEAMVHELLNREITSDLKRAPETEALKGQRERFVESRQDTIQVWLYDAIEIGHIEALCYESDNDMEDSPWPKLVQKPELYEAYKKWVGGSGVPHNPVAKSLFYHEVLKYGFVEVRPSSESVIKKSGGKRLRMFQVPSIDELSTIYTNVTGKTI